MQHPYMEANELTGYQLDGPNLNREGGKLAVCF